MSTIINLAQFDKKQGLTAVKAVQLANQKKLRLLSNIEFDKRPLPLTDTWKTEVEIYPAWTGTLVAYGKPNEKLSSTIEHTDPRTEQRYVFDVPKDAQNQKNIILAINHGFENEVPIFELKEDGNNILVQINDSSKIKIIENFPTKNKWYLPEHQFGIPTGRKVSSYNDEARYLHRTYLHRTNEYVGLLARRYNVYSFDYRLNVVANERPSKHRGVLADQTYMQVPDAKILAPSSKDFENAMKILHDSGTNSKHLKTIQAYVDAKQ